MSTVEIKLNAAAMDRLFPEGTEARVNLQQTIIQNFATRFIKLKTNAELAAWIQPQIRSVTQEVVAEYFNLRHYEKPAVTDVLRESIKTAFREEVQKNIRDVVGEMKDYVTESVDAAKCRITESMDLTITTSLDMAVVKEVRKKVEDKVKLALES